MAHIEGSEKTKFLSFHCNVTGFTSLLEGNVNWPAVMQVLKEVGYDDYIIAELAPYKLYPGQLLENTARAMDKIMGQ